MKFKRITIKRRIEMAGLQMESIAIVVLAAGKSSRFGSPKQLACWQGKPLLQHIVSLLTKKGLKPYVTLGGNFDEIIQRDDLDLSGCHIIKVQNWKEGLAFSIKEALARISFDFEASEIFSGGVLFFLGDQPLINAQDIHALISAIQVHPDSIVCSQYELGLEVTSLSKKVYDSNQKEKIQYNIGVPAYFPLRYFDALCELKGDEGAKSIIKKNGYMAVTLENAMFDVDEPEDLARAIDLTKSK